jgi:hypothetical protein
MIAWPKSVCRQSASSGVHRQPGLAVADVVPVGVGAVGHAAAEQADGEIRGGEAHGEQQAIAAIHEAHGGFGGDAEDLAQVAGARKGFGTAEQHDEGERRQAQTPW